MVTVRTAKSKGSQAEYNAWESLKQISPNVLLTKQLGFQLQYDLVDHDLKRVFEVKRLKALSWNEATKYFKKLDTCGPEGYQRYLLFKSNQQPCLVMMLWGGELVIREFENVFGVPFIKHKSTRHHETLL